ncbi:MAG: diguanylate cyclase [Lachnospiraceae bacterium]|nr:diguanylate cyclase [Lachnospiraceae bacterium]
MSKEALERAVADFENKILSAEDFDASEVTEVIEKHRDLGEKGLMGMLYYYRAYAYLVNGFQFEAIEDLNLSIAGLLGSEREKEVARAYNMLGVIANGGSNLILAHEHYETALTYAAKYDEDIIQGMVWGNLAELLHRVGSEESAEKYYKRFLETFDSSDDVDNNNGLSMFKRAAGGYGYVLLNLGKVEETGELLEKIDTMPETIFDPSSEMSVASLKAYYHKLIGDMDGAREYIRKTLDVVKLGINITSSYDQIQNFMQFLIDLKDYKSLGALLDLVTPQAAIEKNEGFMLQLLQAQLKYCSENMDSEAYVNSTQTFFKIKEKYEQSENAQILSMMELRNKLSYLENEEEGLKERNLSLEFQAEHDFLTGLYNKRYLNDYAEATFEKTFIKRENLGVLFADIDNFKILNDTYGHAEGDKCISAVATTIKRVMRNDFAARYGGDEFVMIFSGRSRDYVEDRAWELIDEIKKLDMYGGVSITIGGIYARPERLNKIWDYFKAADSALYMQKEIQRGSFKMTLREDQTLLT